MSLTTEELRFRYEAAAAADALKAAFNREHINVTLLSDDEEVEIVTPDDVGYREIIEAFKIRRELLLKVAAGDYDGG